VFRTSHAHEHRVVWLFTTVVAILLLLIGGTLAQSDFGLFFWPAYQMLQAGDLHGFRAHLTGEATFMTLFGAPAAYLAGLTGGGEVATARFVAMLPIAAFVLFVGHLSVQARANRRRWWPIIVLLAMLPIARAAVAFGHSEDLLAAAAAIGAVLLALENRPKLAGALLVVAIVAKPWAVLGIGPAVLAAPCRGLLVGAIGAVGGALVLLSGALLTPSAAGLEGGGALTSVGGELHAQTLFWALAPGPTVDPAFEPARSYAAAPAWMGISHPLIAALALPLSLLWRRSRDIRSRPRDEALLLLALLFLLRCALDPWNNLYYHLPLVLVLLTWEVRRDRFPLLTAGASACVILTCRVIETRVGWEAFAAWSLWAVPLGVLLAWHLYAPAKGAARRPERTVAEVRVAA
jgi:hypothetical protein